MNSETNDFAVELIDKLSGIFRSLADIIRDLQERWFPNNKLVNSRRGKAPLRAKIAKYKKAPRGFMAQKSTVLLLDKRAKIHRCRNHCRKYGRQAYN